MENHERAQALVGPVAPTTEEQQRRAALFVASNATDATDCTELLMALGLLDPGFRWHSVGTGYGKRRRIATEAARGEQA